MSVTRREFLSVGGSAVVFLAGGSSSAAAECAVVGDRRLLKPWIAVTQSNRIVVLVDKCEMGQGVRDLFARVVADELGVLPDDMLVEDAPVGRPYRNAKFPIPVLRFQITGYSSSTADAWEKLKVAASETAQALRNGAADKLRVSPILTAAGPGRPRPRAAADDLVSALVNLGYRPGDAERAASAAREQSPDAPIESLVRAALQLLAAKAV